MDPATTIASIIDGSLSRREGTEALRSWYAMKGGRPGIMEVYNILTSRSCLPPPRNWRSSARALGAVS